MGGQFTHSSSYSKLLLPISHMFPFTLFGVHSVSINVARSTWIRHFPFTGVIYAAISLCSSTSCLCQTLLMANLLDVYVQCDDCACFHSEMLPKKITGCGFRLVRMKKRYHGIYLTLCWTRCLSFLLQIGQPSKY